MIMIKRALFLSLILITSVSVLNAGEKAKQFIQGLGDEAIMILSNKSYTAQEREDKFDVLFRRGLAIQKIGAFAVARHWRQATNEQRIRYLKLFSKIIVQTYSKRLSQYSNEKFAVTSVRENEDNSFTVMSEVRRQEGPPLNLQWRVILVKGDLKVVDVVIEGVSMLITQRSEFSSIITKKGNGIEGLIEELKLKAS